jgi:hypothetical protein
MAQMVELSRGLRRPNGAIGGFFAALKLGLSRLTLGRRNKRLELEEWPDYLLRDIGLDRTARESADPRSVPMEWPLR